MDLSHIIGNDEIKTFLLRMISTERVGHSLLFAGTDGIGKSLFATALAQNLLATTRENHPDLHIYRPEGKLAMHSIDTMRAFNDEVHMPPNEAKYKVFIIHDADRMLSTGANALLKTFEEPSPHTLIILLSSSPQALLPTVMSRCRKLYFQPIAEAQIAAFLQQKHSCSIKEAERIAARSSGSIGRAMRLLSQPDDNKRDLMLDTLSSGRLPTYKHLATVVDTLNTSFEALKESLSAACTSEIAPRGFEELTATQRDAFQKEIDGAVTLRVREEVDALFEVIMGWYRDLELLRCGGNTNLLVHRDRLEPLRHAFQCGRNRPLKDVQEAVVEARTNIQRSSSIRSTLESLLLKLDLI
ncbi:MAG: DNA polymerase III subunit [Chlamydiales bacterium]|nr:DNA polymerase III subunit [Chlamydiales bacterium]